MKTFFTLLIFSAFLIPVAKGGTFGMGDYVWKDDASQTLLKKDTSYVKNDRNPVDLEMSLGMWTFFKTQANGTLVLQYARGNANQLPYVAGASGTTASQSPNYGALVWQTINTDSVGKDWVLARNFSSLTEGDYTPSGLADYSGIGAYAGPTLTTPTHILNFGGKVVTSNASGITLDGTTVPGFVSGDYNYIKGALKFAIMPGSTILPDSVYSFRLFVTSGAWDGNNVGGRGAGDVTLNFNHFDGTQNEVMGHASEGNPDPNAVNGGNHFDHGMPIIATGPDILTNTGLPVKWSAAGLQGSVRKNSVLLTWSTETEVNSKEFIAQRSADGGKTFINIGQPISSKAAGGNSSSPLSYSFTDASPIANAVYRVEQVDLDGKADYSNAINISLNGASEKLSVYPNPVASSMLNVKGVSAGSSYRIIGMGGANVAQGVLNGTQVDVSRLAFGVYILQVIYADRSVQVATFIKK